ncbi:sufE-like protein 1, chloroplastic/mitochondrial [Amborella trichopoda]|nr:sufE-like protein 1, chloroplastic/mitochondrial [Amborella trichopoda]|eukprot:XP_006857681.2 sufE-like protein 1, chloroplastic/mitochondrial [Amborella trichopoda]
MSICSSFRVFSPNITPTLYTRKTLSLSIQFISKPLTPSSLNSNSCVFPLISLRKEPKSRHFSVSLSPISMQAVEELPPKLKNTVELFQSVQDPRTKYEQLLYYGRKLNPLGNEFKTRENKVEGCVSQVWVRAYLDDSKNVWFEADSDAVLTKGLAALLVEGLSGNSPPEIVKISPDFIHIMGLNQSLSPSRNNGFLNMFKLMQRKALQLYIESEKSEDQKELRSLGSNGSSVEAQQIEVSEKPSESADVKSHENEMGFTVLSERGERIIEKLERELVPIELEVEDVSYQHAGHMGAKGEGGETHFNLRIVSDKFEGKSLIKRHRLVYDLLKEELDSGLHALSIVAKTPSEN